MAGDFVQNFQFLFPKTGVGDKICCELLWVVPLVVF